MSMSFNHKTLQFGRKLCSEVPWQNLSEGATLKHNYCHFSSTMFVCLQMRIIHILRYKINPCGPVV